MTRTIAISQNAIDKALQDMLVKRPHSSRLSGGIRINLTRQEMRDAYKKALESVRQEANV